MKIGTYNIRYDAFVDKDWSWQARKPFVLAQLKAMDCDVFGIDEALPHQREDLVAAFPDHDSLGVARDNGVDEGEFNLLFYRKARFDLIDSGYEWISATKDQPSRYPGAGSNRIIVWAVLEDKATQKRFLAAVTHLDDQSEEARVFGVSRIRQLVEAHDDLPAIVVGDFNMYVTDEGYKQMVSFMDDSMLDDEGQPIVTATFQDNSEFHPHNPSRFTRIDYLFTRGMKTLGVTAGTMIADNGLYPSDHFPVWGVYQLV